jgi:putative polysaccharide biosynthesis protein
MSRVEHVIEFEQAAQSRIDRLRRLTRRLSAAASRSGLSRLAIAVRLIDVWRRTGIRPGEAASLGLGDPAISAESLSGCFSKRELLELQNALNPAELICLTEDKSLFYPFCQGLGIPVPATLAIVSRAGGWAGAGGAVTAREAWVRHFAEALPSTFITKPARGVYGVGFTAWTRTESGFADHQGRSHTAAELYDRLISNPRHRSYVVQERLENHPDIIRLTGSQTLQTVRAATLVEPDGCPRFLYAEWKVAVSPNVIDNFRGGKTGNLAVNVGRDSGMLSQALRRSPDGVGYEAIPNHPDTSLPLEGARLPDWSALADLVVKCAVLFLPLRTIGWDVALTPRGPVIVEGNRWWDPPNAAVLGPAVPGVAQPEMVSGAALLRRYGRPPAEPGPSDVNRALRR